MSAQLSDSVSDRLSYSWMLCHKKPLICHLHVSWDADRRQIRNNLFEWTGEAANLLIV